MAFSNFNAPSATYPNGHWTFTLSSVAANQDVLVANHTNGKLHFTIDHAGSNAQDFDVSIKSGGFVSWRPGVAGNVTVTAVPLHTASVGTQGYVSDHQNELNPVLVGNAHTSLTTASRIFGNVY